WSEVLGIEKIGIDDNFFSLGGHSLTAIMLTSKMHKAFSVRVTLAQVFRTPTVRGIAAYIKAGKGEQDYRFPGIRSVEAKDYYVLSSAQKRLYILQQFAETGTAYNTPRVLHLEGKLDRQRLETTFRKLICRHENLRTSFTVVDDEPVQRIHHPGKIEFKIEYSSAGTQPLRAGETNAGEHEVQSSSHHSSFIAHNSALEFIRPFDLSQAPLMRVVLIEISAGSFLFVLDMHHIISDGISIGLFLKDFLALYNGESLAPLKLQYKDFSEWQNGRRSSDIIKAQEAYWLETLAGEIPVLNLPTDFPRPTVQSFKGSRVSFELEAGETGVLKALALKENVTLYMVLFALFNIFLSRLSGREDIIVGTPIEGRKHVDLAQVLGMFVNALSVRSFPTGKKKFGDFLGEIKEQIGAALENQEYQFEELVEKVAVNRDAGRNPLFDVVFLMQNLDIPAVEIPGFKLAAVEFESKVAKFDLTFICDLRSRGGTGEVLCFEVEYRTDLFLEETIKRFISYFRRIVTAVTGNPELRIGEIEILSGEEKRRLLYDFNKAAGAYPADKTIPQLFADQVRRTPKNKALVFAGQELSYLELDEASGGITGYLLSRGAASGSLIGIMINRSIEMITGILGILKTGSGYVPLNPKAPPERTRYILEECGVELLLSSTGLSEKVAELSASGWQGETVFIDDPEVRTGAEARVGIEKKKPVSSGRFSKKEEIVSSSFIGRGPAPAHIAYVIFTSGSTGKPKGVPISHSNFCPLMFWGYEKLGIGPGDRTIQNLSYYFDWSVWEIFIALTGGSSLYMISDEVLLNPGLEVDFILKNKITTLHITPTQYRYLINVGKKLHTLKYLAIGAEKLTYDLTVSSLESVNEDCRVFNMYGPTETTIMAAVLEIDRRKVEKYKSLSSVPIGETIANTALLILDKYNKLCPIGIEGELYIAGDALARGYLNNPELSAEKFPSLSFDLDRPDGSNRSDKSYKTDRAYKLLTTHQSPVTLYRSGDRCRWLADGTVEFLGRFDDQVKIRGFRIEPGEIENRLLEHEGVNEAVVIDRQSAAGEKYLCAYVVGEALPTSPGTEDQGAAAGKLREYLAERLPDYMVPAYFIKIEHVPLNANGKVDRKALPEPGIGAAGRQYTAPRNKQEECLVETWAEVLDIEKSIIGIDDNFFELGGHSLKASAVITKLHKKLGKRIPLAEIFKTPYIRKLARYIKGAAKYEYTSLEPVEKKSHYVLTSAQKRLYILQQVDPAGTVYNIPVFVPLDRLLQSGFGVDKEKLERTFRELIRRHESLRTSFHLMDEQPVQKVHEPREILFEIENYDLSAGGFVRSFDLSFAPLLRVGLLETNKGQYLLMVDMHHIICDGISHEILLRDFRALYSGKQLAPLAIQYKDYSQWLNKPEQMAVSREQEAYWQEIFSGEIPVLNLPTDFPRPAVQSFAGDNVVFEIAEERTRALKALALENNVSLFMFLSAIIYVWLAKISSREDIVIGTVAAGRRHADLDKVIGMFV
ncbi:MAG: amino acid adenylation domain-containing protein, partial [Candidatus Aminicenantes bacterium]|nr:amino acid adenylation domain-containing protein [Candidatus Aminicenantes bacterium]